MEDMARLALVEQSVRDVDTFSKILYEMLYHINLILENPHDYDLRTLSSNVIKGVLKHDAFIDYLIYLGFKRINNDFIYPKESTLSNLRAALFSIERKLTFVCGPQDNRISVRQGIVRTNLHTRDELRRVQIFSTNNDFLQKLEMLFNNMLTYENEELQAQAREQIPLVTLQLKAIDTMREHQKKIKSGESQSEDLSFDIALLMQLLGWFKYKYFSWVDRPPCDACGGPTQFHNTTQMREDSETCRVEIFKCTRCPSGGAQFPRHNNPATLLRTRRGRCGEWASCFVLFCRALGYDTRYVYDTTDHVWCEIFDYDSNTWMHADPCEAKLNAPLLYTHGWKKRLCYVIAVSKDDLQDVTWRYTSDHKEVRQRRDLCSERELIGCIMSLREQRHRQLSDARRKYLTKRALEELVQMMVERQPSDYESHGRLSGSKEWRLERGEMRSGEEGYVFELDQAGEYCVQYYPGDDIYRVFRDNVGLQDIGTWAAAVFDYSNIFRKIEHDWQMVYLAREDGDSAGTVSWKWSVSAPCVRKLQGSSVCVSLSAATYGSARLDWTLSFDGGEPEPVEFGETPTKISRSFRSVEIGARLSGGEGSVSWQHAQLFRRQLPDKGVGLDVKIQVDTRA